MTQKLFYEDQYINEFTAEVLTVLEIDGMYHIQLDKTAFFPGGGGQPCDTGLVESCAIVETYEKSGIIYHVSSKKPIKIHRVKCSVDWSSRFDGMQQHLGQHVLSAAFLKLFGANTVSFHLGKDICTTDIDKLLSDDELEQAEALANSYIYENYPVDFLTPSKSELKKLSLRRVPDINEDTLRVVRIKDIDTTACCGLHPKSTLEVQILKIRRKEKAKGNLRIEYVCGKRAVDDCINKYKFTSTICRKLNCNEEEALIRIDNITSEFGSLSFENKNLKSQLADFQVQSILNSSDKVSNISVIKEVFNSSDMKYINTLATKLTSNDNVVVLYGLKNEGMAYLLFMCSKNIKSISMNELLKDAITLIDGKGGGSSFSAQGGGKGINNLESSVEYAFSKAKNLVK
jgi:alanyl-tRNA synthetase